MSETRAPVEVRHSEEASRFEATVDGSLCFAAYVRQDGVLRMNHTSVPSQLEGRGIAAAIVRAAIAHAAAEGLRIEPRCSYVRAYMRRHPETHALLPDGFPL